MLVAVPAMARPAAKVTKPPMSGQPIPRLSDRAPLTTIPTRLERKKALNTQPYSRKSPRCRLTTGSTVATDRLSNATTVTFITSAPVNKRRPGAQTP